MIVLKFGGTSVGSPARMREVATIVDSTSSALVILSAVSGTTNALVEIAALLGINEKQKALDKIASVKKQYIAFYTELLKQEDLRLRAAEMVDAEFNALAGYAVNGFGPKQEKEILSKGEILSTHLFYLYLTQLKKKAVLLNALDFMRINEQGEPDLEYITANLQLPPAANNEKIIYITQGYICRNAFGEIDNLKRGGSDYTASLVGAALNAEEIQIWTDIDGMHNNDPRYVDKTFPVRELSFDEAAELAYFGAKILHPNTITPAQQKNIPVRLKNTMDPKAQGTLISSQTKGNGIKAIAAKDGITAIKIKSGRMLMAYGFLRSVFEVFERYQTPIDMITTSEVAVSVTIDNNEYLAPIVEEINRFGTVEVDTDQTIICMVGNLVAETKGYA
ncbi:MAG: aspartate kinase, partial [Flavobacteriales bacterium]